MKHKFIKKYGEIDIFRLNEGIHNGPECELCHKTACHHCYPYIYKEECEANKPN